VPAGQSDNTSQLNRHRDQSPFANTDDFDPVPAARRLRVLNEERQKSMVSDTEKLLKLAQELNTEIGSGDQPSLTPIQVRKVADIEKLAHNIRQKMSISFAAGPEFRDPLVPTIK
jgi:hypothetical protein